MLHFLGHLKSVSLSCPVFEGMQIGAIWMIYHVYGEVDAAKQTLTVSFLFDVKRYH